MAEYDIVVTRGRRLGGMQGTVIGPTTVGVEARLENGEQVSLRNQDYDYLSEYGTNVIDVFDWKNRK